MTTKRGEVGRVSVSQLVGVGIISFIKNLQIVFIDFLLSLSKRCNVENGNMQIVLAPKLSL